jgi:hypothetical protein
VAGTPGVNIEYVEQVDPQCPINTPPTAYLTTDVPVLDQTFLWKMGVRIPPGHAGYTGIALVDSGSFILPFAQASMQWLTGDDDYYEFPYGDQLGSTVSLAYYNTSTDFPHGWQVHLTYTPLSVLNEGGDVIITPDLTSWLAEIGQDGQ